MPITVRPARLDDAPTLVDFNAAMALETEHLTLEHDTLARGVRAGIEDPAKARYFVADDGGRVVGMLMLTLEWRDWREGESWGIQRVYVHAEFGGRGGF